MVLGSRSASGMSSKGRRMHVSTFLRAPYSELGCWSFQAGRHLVVTYSPNRVRALTGSGSVGWECLAALALEGPPLGLGAHGGRCRPSVGGCRPGCGPGSAREGGGEGGTIAIQAITMPPCRRSPDEVRPALRMSPTEFRMRRPQ